MFSSRIGARIVIAAAAAAAIVVPAAASAQQVPSVGDLTAEVMARVGEGGGISLGGGTIIVSDDATMMTETAGTIGADGGSSVATGDVPGGADGTGALAVNAAD